MSKLLFLFLFILKIQNLFAQQIISLSPYQYQLQKIFNSYLKSLKKEIKEDTLKIQINATNFTIDLSLISLSYKTNNIKPYIDTNKKNCLIFAPYPISFEFTFLINNNNSYSIDGTINYNLYYIYVNQRVENFEPIFELLLKEKKTNIESNYDIIIYNAETNMKKNLIDIINKNSIFLKYRQLFENEIIKCFNNTIKQEYNYFLPITLSKFFFPNANYKINLEFIKFPEIYKKESIMTFFSGNINDDPIENITNNMDEEFKKFNEFQQTKKKYFINYSLLQKIINKSIDSNYEIEIVNDKSIFLLPDDFFEVKKWEDLIDKPTSVNKILLFLKIKNITLNNDKNLEIKLEMNIKNNEKVLLNKFNISVILNMKADLKNTCSINICASNYKIVNETNQGQLQLAKEKMDIIFKNNYQNICLFDNGIDLESEFIYIDDYYFKETGIYLIGEDRRN